MPPPPKGGAVDVLTRGASVFIDTIPDGMMAMINGERARSSAGVGLKRGGFVECSLRCAPFTLPDAA